MGINMADKKMYQEISNHLLNDQEPSIYLKSICNEQSFKAYPFNMLYELQSTEQSPQHHTEGSVWNHTLMVVDEAAKVKNKSKNPTAFMWAALLHDIGKHPTTRMRRGKITSYDHDKVGAKLCKEFLVEFINDEKFIDEVRGLVRYHMHILFVVKDLPFANIEEMKKQTDIDEVALLGLCDRLGRGKVDREKEEENIKIFKQKLKK